MENEIDTAKIDAMKEMVDQVDNLKKKKKKKKNKQKDDGEKVKRVEGNFFQEAIILYSLYSLFCQLCRDYL